MLNHRTASASLLAILLGLGLGVSSVSADSRRGDDRRGDDRKPRVERGYQLDQRHHHDRYYPPRGEVVDRLPRGPVIVPHRNTNYYFHGGAWYRSSGSRFVVVAPPIGLSLSMLPPFYTTLWIGGAPYHYADGVYYQWRPSYRDYVIVDPPREAESASVTPEAEQIFVYPKQGQSEQQMADDRYECHRWAVGETGFDPSNLDSRIAPSELAEKRANYQRATKACLEAREYSVK
jgi:hypothetical protein